MGGMRRTPALPGSYCGFALFGEKLVVIRDRQWLWCAPGLVLCYIIDQESGLSFCRSIVGPNLENVLCSTLWEES